MELASLKDLYVAELQELLSAQKQLAEPLARVAEVVSNPELKETLKGHSEETVVQQRRIATILNKHAAETNAHTDQAMRALVAEVGKMAAMLRGHGLRDAGLIGSLQRLEHYEIAAYGTAAALAGQLGLSEEQKLLHHSLEENKRFDATLTKLATHELNPNAASA